MPVAAERLNGDEPAATLGGMLPGRDDLATKADLSAVRDELISDMSDIRKEIGLIRSEMELKFATRDDLLEVWRDFESSVQGMVPTFIAVQTATVVGMPGILFGLLQLT